MSQLQKTNTGFKCTSRNGEYNILVSPKMENSTKEDVLLFRTRLFESSIASHNLGKNTEQNLINRYHLNELEKQKDLTLNAAKNSEELNNMLCAAYLTLQTSCNIYHDISCPPKEEKSRKKIHELQEQLSSDLLEFYYSLNGTVSVTEPKKGEKMRFIDKIFEKDGKILFVQIKNGSPVNQSMLNQNIAKLIQEAVAHETVTNLTIISTRCIDTVLKKASVLPFNKNYINVIYLADILANIITYANVKYKHGEDIIECSNKFCDIVTTTYGKILEELSTIC